MRLAYFLPKEMKVPPYPGGVQISALQSIGVDVLEIPYEYWLRDSTTGGFVQKVNQAIKRYRPHVIHVEGAALFRVPNLAARLDHWKKSHRCKVSLWYGDCRGEDVPEALKESAPVVDLFLTNNSGLLPFYQSIGFRMAIEHHMSADAQLYGPDKSDPGFDIVFAGNNYPRKFPLSAEREALLVALSNKFRVLVQGFGWNRLGKKATVKPYTRGHERMGRFYASGKVVLGINHYDVANYYTERTWQGLSSGRAYLVRYIPGIERDFKDGEHLVTFRTIAEAVEKAGDLLAGQWHNVAARGRAIFLTEHTWRHRFARYKQLVESLN